MGIYDLKEGDRVALNYLDKSFVTTVQKIIPDANSGTPVLAVGDNPHDVISIGADKVLRVKPEGNPVYSNREIVNAYVEASEINASKRLYSEASPTTKAIMDCICSKEGPSMPQNALEKLRPMLTVEALERQFPHIGSNLNPHYLEKTTAEIRETQYRDSAKYLGDRGIQQIQPAADNISDFNRKLHRPLQNSTSFSNSTSLSLRGDEVATKIDTLIQGDKIPSTPRRPDVRLIVQNTGELPVEFKNPGGHAAALESIPPQQAAMIMLKGETLQAQQINAAKLDSTYNLSNSGLSPQFLNDLRTGKLSTYIEEAYGPAPLAQQAARLENTTWTQQDGKNITINPVKGTAAAYGVRPPTQEQVVLLRVDPATNATLQGTNTSAEKFYSDGKNKYIALAIDKDWKTGEVKTRPIAPDVAKQYYGDSYKKIPVIDVDSNGNLSRITQPALKETAVVSDSKPQQASLSQGPPSVTPPPKTWSQNVMEGADEGLKRSQKYAVSGTALGVAMGTYGLYQKLGEGGTAQKDLADEKTKGLAMTSVALDSANVGLGAAILTTNLAANTASGAKLLTTVVGSADDALGILTTTSRWAGKAGPAIALAAGAIEFEIARRQKDADRATNAIGNTLGGMGGGMAGALAGAKTFAIAGAAIGSAIPGAGTVAGATVGATVGALAGAFGGGWYGAELGRKAAHSTIGDWIKEKISPARQDEPPHQNDPIPKTQTPSPPSISPSVSSPGENISGQSTSYSRSGLKTDGNLRDNFSKVSEPTEPQQVSTQPTITSPTPKFSP